MVCHDLSSNVRLAQLPIIVDANGQKLSKQSKAPALEDDKASANLFMLLGWLNQSPPFELGCRALGCH